MYRERSPKIRPRAAGPSCLITRNRCRSEGRSRQNLPVQEGRPGRTWTCRHHERRRYLRQFFLVRLWDQDELIQELLDHYDALSADVKAELPLKRIWSLSVAEEDGGAE